MTVTTKRPNADGDPCPTTTDSQTARSVSTENWATIRAGAGTRADPCSVNAGVMIRASTTANTFARMDRAAFLFDFSCVCPCDNKDSATFDFAVVSKSEDIGTDSISMVTATPASNTNIVSADFTQFGATKQAADLTIGGLTVDVSCPVTFNQFVLNSTGLGNISLSGVSKFGIRMTSDNDNTDKTGDLPACHTDCDENSANIRSADEGDAADTRPKMLLTHTSPTTFISRAVIF
jgi:hypothetical protein